jgi:endonuclease/exonuclease/phosphatase family metal-dependent hydrolase
VLEEGHIAQLLTLAPGLVIANTHLKWNQPGEQFGERQARQILESLPQASLQIICGDLNAEPGSGPLKIFEDAGFTYPHRESPTCNSNHRAKQIDFILTRGPAQVTPLPCPPIEDHTPLPSSTHPSDHLPLLVTLELPKT